VGHFGKNQQIAYYQTASERVKSGKMKQPEKMKNPEGSLEDFF